jgi:anti-sigma-K factor RskA
MFEPMNNETLDKEKSWLAAEYALGVSDGNARVEAEKLVERDAVFRRSVDAWQNQLSPLLDEVNEVEPPKNIWANIENSISPVTVDQTESSSGGSIWKLITAFTSTVSVACIGGLLYISGGDFSSGSVSELKQRLTASEQNIANANASFAEARERSKELEAQLADTTAKLENANTQLAQANGSVEAANAQVAEARAEVASLRQQFETTRPLVASLTQSGDAPAFVAQYDPLKKSLLIRTAVEDSDEKVPEIWLIPAQGDKKGEVLSLGVMNENAPDEVKITDEFISLIGEGGTLAITMEPPGGSPTGVATGPVIALGKLQSF